MANKINKEFIMDFERGIITESNTHPDPIDEECRICFESGNLIYPCNCNSGIHSKCLKRWIISEQNTHPKECEICKTPYRIAYNRLFSEQNIFIRNAPPPPTSRRGWIQPPPPPPPPPLQQSANIIQNINRRQIIPRIDPDSWTENRYMEDEVLSRIIVNERNRISHNNKKQWFQNGFIFLFVGDVVSLIIYFNCDKDIICRENSGVTALIMSVLITLLFVFYWFSLASIRTSISDNS